MGNSRRKTANVQPSVDQWQVMGSENFRPIHLSARWISKYPCWVLTIHQAVCKIVCDWTSFHDRFDIIFEFPFYSTLQSLVYHFRPLIKYWEGYLESIPIPHYLNIRSVRLHRILLPLICVSCHSILKIAASHESHPSKHPSYGNVSGWRSHLLQYSDI